MKYRVLWDKEALYDLKRIDKTTDKKIVEKVSSIRSYQYWERSCWKWFYEV